MPPAVRSAHVRAHHNKILDVVQARAQRRTLERGAEVRAPRLHAVEHRRGAGHAEEQHVVRLFRVRVAQREDMAVRAGQRSHVADPHTRHELREACGGRARAPRSIT